MSTESDIYAEPDMTKKVRKRDRDRGQRGDTEDSVEMEERVVDTEDSVEMEERVVDIYESADAVLGPQSQEDMRDNAAGRHTQVIANLVAVSGQQRSKAERRPFRVVAACLGMMCLILLGVNIGQAVHYRSPRVSTSMTNNTLVHDNNTLKSINDTLTLNTWLTIHNLTQENIRLSTNYDSLMQEKNQLQSEVKQLKTQTADKSCPKGWTKFGCSCYFRSTVQRTWQEGRDYCLREGADLVIINSGEEQVFIRGLRSAGGSTYSWIGLTRTDREGSWTWADDGTPLTTQYWYSGFPRNTEDRNCAVYNHWTDPGTWINVLCSEKRISICEK